MPSNSLIDVIDSPPPLLPCLRLGYPATREVGPDASHLDGLFPHFRMLGLMGKANTSTIHRQPLSAPSKQPIEFTNSSLKMIRAAVLRRSPTPPLSARPPNFFSAYGSRESRDHVIIFLHRACTTQQSQLRY
jgi:hypothetical protein